MCSLRLLFTSLIFLQVTISQQIWDVVSTRLPFFSSAYTFIHGVAVANDVGPV